jgi:hypothetical protein
MPVTTDRCGFNIEHTKSIIAARQKLAIPGNSFCAAYSKYTVSRDRRSSFWAVGGIKWGERGVIRAQATTSLGDEDETFAVPRM